MKIKFLLLAVLMCCFVGQVAAAEPEKIPVVVKDETGPIPIRIHSASPINVYITENRNIEVIFEGTSSTFEVTIRNSHDMVIYSKSVIVALSNELNIDISNYPSDAYTISFKDKNSGKTYGGNFKTD